MKLAECFELLEVETGAPKDAVRKQYQKLSRKWHPDVTNHDDKAEANDMMQRINEAYGTIMKGKDYRGEHDGDDSDDDDDDNWEDMVDMDEMMSMFMSSMFMGGPGRRGRRGGGGNPFKGIPAEVLFSMMHSMGGPFGG